MFFFLKGKPVCVSSPETVLSALRTTIKLECYVSYRGVFTPNVTWTSSDGTSLGSIQDVTSDNVTARAEVKLDGSYNVTRFTCVVTAQSDVIDKGVGQLYDRESPVFLDNCSINVLHIGKILVKN